MEFCGGHTHAISRYGVTDLLPANVRMIHGPGCPVCVLPIGRVDMAIRPGAGAGRHPLHLRRLPARAGLRRPVADEGEGARRRHPHGLFERRRAEDGAGQPGARRWSSSPSASRPRRRRRRWPIKQAPPLGLKNFSRALLPRADAVGDRQHPRIAGSAPVGHRAARRLHRPGARVDGHRQPALRVLRRGVPQAGGHRRLRAARRHAGDPDADAPGQRRPGRGRKRVLAGRRRATATSRRRNLVAEVFELRREFEWRGLGVVPYSALRIRREFAEFDAEQRFALDYRRCADHKACECGAILRGVKRPQDCKLFGTVCTPENPIGSCMVSFGGGLRGPLHLWPLQGCRDERGQRKTTSDRST